MIDPDMISLADIALQRTDAALRLEDAWTEVRGVVMGRIVPESAARRAEVISRYEGCLRELEVLRKLEVEVIANGRAEMPQETPEALSAPETPRPDPDAS